MRRAFIIAYEQIKYEGFLHYGIPVTPQVSLYPITDKIKIVAGIGFSPLPYNGDWGGLKIDPTFAVTEKVQDMPTLCSY